MPTATEAKKSTRTLDVKKNKKQDPKAQTYNVDEIEEKGLPLDPVTPLNRLIWKLDITKDSAKANHVRRLPRRAVVALGERGIIQIQHLAGIRASELKMLPGVGNKFMRNIAQAAKLAGVNIISDVYMEGENVSVSLSGNLVDAARHFVGAYLQVSPADLLRSAIMEHEEAIVTSMYKRTQDIRNGELDRIHAQIEQLQAQAAQIAQIKLDTLVTDSAAFTPEFRETAQG